jgi:hypothetical protein
VQEMIVMPSVKRLMTRNGKQLVKAMQKMMLGEMQMMKTNGRMMAGKKASVRKAEEQVRKGLRSNVSVTINVWLFRKTTFSIDIYLAT